MLFHLLQSLCRLALRRPDRLDEDDIHRVEPLVQIFHGGEALGIVYMAHMLRGKNSRITNATRKGEYCVGSCEHVFAYMNKIEDMFANEG